MWPWRSAWAPIFGSIAGSRSAWASASAISRISRWAFPSPAEGATMRVGTRLIALVALGAAGTTGALAAQVRFLPVRNAGVGTGIGIAADVGFPNAAAGNGL